MKLTAPDLEKDNPNWDDVSLVLKAAKAYPSAFEGHSFVILEKGNQYVQTVFDIPTDTWILEYRATNQDGSYKHYQTKIKQLENGFKTVLKAFSDMFAGKPLQLKNWQEINV